MIRDEGYACFQLTNPSGGLNDLGVVQTEVERIRFLVNLEFHGLLLVVRSKYSVATTIGYRPAW
jgi:hypothetical protein